jgi:hypothetical protein
MYSGKSLSQALAETPAAALIARCERAERAARLIATALGDTAAFPGPSLNCTCQIREHALLIFASSVAQAAKLRQALPRLHAVLQDRGLNLSEIRVRVQPDPSAEANSGGGPTDVPSASATRKPQPLPAGALLFADKLALTLRPSALRDAAERLAQSLRAVRTR